MSIDVMMIGLRSIGGGQGGVEKHVACLVEEYDRRGVRTCVVVRNHYADKHAPSIGAHSWTKTLWAPRSVTLEAPVHSILATLYAGLVRPKILHVHAVGPSIVVPLARLLGLKVVCTHHGQDYDREKWGRMARGVLKLGERCQAHFANARICVSSSLSAKLSAIYPRPFQYIPNAVRMPPAPDAFDGLAAFGLEAGKYIVNVGRLVPEKRQMDLIEAYRAMGRDDIKLALVGGADHASEYSVALEKAAAATPGVVMTGFQSGDVLAQLIGGAGVFALPSSHEGMPIAALEAMCMNRPIVLSDIAPNLDLRLPHACYHAVTSVKDLSARLSETLDHYKGVDLPFHDWSAALRSYDWSSVAEQTLNAYRSASASFDRSEAILRLQ